MYHVVYNNSSIFFDAADIFFDLFPGQHNLMRAAHAFKPYIHSDAKYFPFMASAGMRFFQSYYIACFKIHKYSFLILKSLRAATERLLYAGDRNDQPEYPETPKCDKQRYFYKTVTKRNL